MEGPADQKKCYRKRQLREGRQGDRLTDSARLVFDERDIIMHAHKAVPKFRETAEDLAAE